MSTTVDERVVEMRFDNSDFEKNVHQSMSTLDKLKEKLNFSKSSEALMDIEKASSKITFGDLSSSIDGVSIKINGLGIMASRVLSNIADDVYNTAKRISSSITIDQFFEGWKKYADKTTAVQTIMSATRDAYRDDNGIVDMEAQLEDVNYQLERLNWFTDETSYNFVDMVDNIGKFTANSVKLDDAVTSMMGIANWAGVSGQSAAAASRAMYNLAQATGAGAVKLVDWKSIENANMATAEFKKRAIEVAEAMGLLKKNADGTAKTLDGTIVTVENFSQTLSEGWFTTGTGSVLEQVLNDYGGFANALRDAVEATDISATDFLTAIEDYQNGSLDLTNLAKDAGMSVEDLSEMVKYLASDTFEFGREAFKSAQEAKTFKDAIDATKDAASTAWMNIFESIFGDYNQARKVWTQMSSDLWDIFIDPVDRLSSRLKKALGTTFYWNNGNLVKTDEEIRDIVISAGMLRGELDLSEENIEAMVTDWKNNHEAIKGNEYVASILANSMGLIADILGIIREAWRSVFSPSNADYLFWVAKGVSEFVENLRPSEEQVENLTEALAGFFSIFKPIVNLISAAIKMAGILASELGSLLMDGIRPILSFIGRHLGNLSDIGRDTTKITKSVSRFRTVVEKLFSKIRTGISKTIGGVRDFWENFKNTEIYKDTFAVLESKFTTLFDKIRKYFEVGSDGSSQFYSDIKNVFSKISTVVSNAGEWFSTTFGTIRNLLVGTGEDSGALKDKLSELWNYLKDNNPFTTISDGLDEVSSKEPKAKSKVFENIAEFFNNIGENVKPIGQAMDTLGSAGNISTYLSTVVSNMGAGLQSFFTTGITFEDVMGFISSGALAAGILGLGDALKKLQKVVPDFAALVSSLSTAVSTLSKSAALYLNKKGWSELGKGLLYVAGAVLMVSGAAYLLKDLNTDQLLKSVGVVAGLIAVFGGLYVALGMLSKSRSGSIDDIVSTLAMSQQLKSVAIVMVSAVLVLKQLEKVDYNKVIDSVKAFGILLVEVAATQVILSNLSGSAGGAKKFIGYAIALLLFTKVLEKLSGVNFDKIKKNLAGHLVDIGLALITFVGLFRVMSGGTGWGVAKMIVLPLALLAFAGVLKKVADIATNIDYSGLILSIGSMWLIMKMFNGFNMMSNVKGVLSTVVSFSAGLYLVSLSVEKLFNVISNIKSKRPFWTFAGVIASLFAISKILTGFTKVASGLPEKNLLSFVIVILSFAGAVAIIGNVMQTLSGLSTKEVMTGAGAIIAIMSMLTAIVRALGTVDMTKINGVGKTLVGITVIMGIFAILIDVLGKMWAENPTQVVQGAIILVGIVVALVALLTALGKIDASVKPSVILSLAAIIVALGAVVYALSLVFSENPDAALAAAGSLTILMGMLAVLMIATAQIKETPGLPKTLLSVAATVSAIGVVVTAMSFVIGSKFSKIWPALTALTLGMVLLSAFMLAVKHLNTGEGINTKGLYAMVGVIAAIGAVFAILSNVMGSAGSGGFLALWPALVAVASGLALVIGALAALGAISGLINKATTALGGLATVIGILVVSIGASVALVGIGIEKIVDSLSRLKDFSETDRNNVKMAVLSVLQGVTDAMEEETGNGRIASAVGQFVGGILTSIVSTIGETLLALVAALSAIVDPVISALMVLLAGIIDGLANAIDAHGDEVVAAIDHLIKSVIALILRTLANGLASLDTNATDWMAEKLNELAGTLVGTITPALESSLGTGNGASELGYPIGEDIVGGVAEGITDNKEAIVEAATETINDVEAETDSGLSGWFGRLWSALTERHVEVTEHVTTLGNSLAGTAGDGVGNIFDTIINATANGEPDLEAAAASAAGAYIQDGLIATFDDNHEAMSTSGGALADAASSGFRETSDKNAYSDAYNTVEGLSSNLNSQSLRSKIWGAMTSLANAASNAFRSVFNIHSPSKLMAEYGEYIVMGLVEGINDDTSYAVDASERFGKKTRDALSESLMLASESLEVGEYSEPVIRPVLDMTDIDNGMASFMANSPAFGLSYALAGQNATSFGSDPTTELSNKIDKFTSAITNLLNNQNLGGTTNNWNISGADPMEIAEQVIYIMESEVNKKENQWV